MIPTNIYRVVKTPNHDLYFIQRKINILWVYYFWWDLLTVYSSKDKAIEIYERLTKTGDIEEVIISNEK